MRGGHQHAGDARRETLSERHLTPRMRSARVRVAETQRPEDGTLVEERHDQRRRRGEPPECQRAGRRTLRLVMMNIRSKRRPARPDDTGHGARQVVASDPRGDDRAHVAGERGPAILGPDAPQRPLRCRHMNETVICQTGEGRAGSLVDNALL